ncbi:DUF3577 domain-containing protein [Burkholderia sp. Bp9012]|uniref:STY4534 family ICE replication protein n=1 Tax=Burkholderia sp. Bp9012 TaxID=2184562 RepID=UPI000F5B7791|nr:STY4534 family ICE replication protein [Burkholderia sp. Bp9012]RQR79191.1 DUF3577 domain-containing protein [Burkholderia sp. Bp9012]
MSSSSESTYFDLHTTGIGYFNRIREVRPKKGKPFWAVDVNILKGSSDKPDYLRFDTNVVGGDAEHLVRRCKDAVDAEKKVLAFVRLGDLWPDTFVYTKGDRAGKTGVSLKARLLYIGWIKIDGKLVYKAEPKAVPTDESDAHVHAQPPEAAPTAAAIPMDASLQASDGEADDTSEIADTRHAVGQSF